LNYHSNTILYVFIPSDKRDSRRATKFTEVGSAGIVVSFDKLSTESVNRSPAEESAKGNFDVDMDGRDFGNSCGEGTLEKRTSVGKVDSRIFPLSIRQ